MSQNLIQALQNPALYPHPVSGFRVLETHISWVILTGEFAYKIKKPMDFGFLDFSTLAKRKYFCEEELRLNQRLAPDIYQEVLALTGSEEAPQWSPLDTSAEAFEFAVKMRQFDADSVLSNQALGGDALLTSLRPLIQRIAHFHENECAVAQADHSFGSAESVFEPVAQNFEQVRPMLQEAEDLAQLTEIERWATAYYDSERSTLDERKRDGFVRECHGDLHLGNIALHQGEALLFDCIEFNDSFRWIDTINDLAFLLMDLDYRNQESVGDRLLNDYLENTGDYAGAALLPFYKSYRAMVRCKIALFTLNSPGMSEEAIVELSQQFRAYLRLASGYARQSTPFLLLTQGLSGSGKTTLSNRVIHELGGIRLRTDVERKRMAGLSALESSGSEHDGGIYTAEQTQLTYSRIQLLAEKLLASSQSVICDGTFLKASQRRVFQELAKAQGSAFAIGACQVEEDTARQWLTARAQSGADAAEADASIMEAQKNRQEAFSEQELASVVQVRMDQEESIQKGLATLKEHLLKG